MLGSTVARSRVSSSEYSASGVFSSWKSPLLAAVGFDQSDLLGAAAAELQILQAFFVDGEDAAGGAVFGRHVSDGGPIGERKITQSRTEVFNKFSDDAMLAQHFRDGENEIGGRSAFPQASGKLHANNLRNQHRDGLAEHGGFGFNAADAPSQNSQAIDHRCVAVGADQGVGIGGALDHLFRGSIPGRRRHGRGIRD